MSHFAKVEDGIVTDVTVAEQDFIDRLEGTWIQTSYNTYGGEHPQGNPLRKNYAGIGYTYDGTRNAFIPPQPFASWTLNETTCHWDSPVPYPDDGGYPNEGKVYNWDEATTNWVEVV